MQKYLIFLLSVLITGNILAQNNTTVQNFSLQQLQAANDAFKVSVSINIKFIVSNKNIINEDLTHKMSIDNVKTLPNGQGYQVYAYLNQDQFQEFLTRNIPYEIIPKPQLQTKAMTMATTVAAMTNWDAYPTYSVYEQLMANFATNYPTRCQIDTILSQTPSGNYKILVAEITNNVGAAANKPQFLYSSSMHGDETTGYVLMLRLINYLLTNYGTVPKITNLLNNVDIWICPLANPDGTYHGSNPPGSTFVTTNGGIQRENQNGKDLNRNYMDPSIGDPSNSGNSSYYPIQPETYAFMNFASAHHFNMSANFHGGAEVTNYPWDDWTASQNPNCDVAWWERVCTAYVDTTRLVTPTYMSDVTANGVTEGADWYSITGGRQDYMNWFQHCREVTIELDGTKTTQTQNLNQKWNENFHSLLNHIQESTYGVRGIITDSCNGQPIRAKVWVNGYDQANDSSQVYSAMPVGNYHKYMIAGTYSITYSAPGYASKTITGVVLANGAATIRNIQLAPAASPDAQFTGALTNSCSATAQFTNTSASATTFMWYFGDGTTSTQTNPTHTYLTNGTYTVKLKASNCKGIDSLVRTNYIVINMFAAPTVTNGLHCGPGMVDISASASGTIDWYSAPTSGTLLYSGTNFTTPVISSTTTYYVENREVIASSVVGKTLTLSGGGSTSTGSHYLIFNAAVSFTLTSVKMNNSQSTAQSKTIQLQDSSGAVVNNQTITVNIPAGTNVVTLNFTVPAQNKLRLVCTDGQYLYRHNTTVAYPYTASNIVSITGSDAGANYYYYFYEWVVQPQGCISSRVPVIATINNVVAEFTHIVATNTANFTNTSTGSTSWQWTFGDGGNSSQQNPSHTYAANGIYTVQLIVSNGNCSDTITHIVSITTVGGISDNAFAGVNLYPNPAQEKLTISLGSAINKPFTIEVFNLSGALVYKNSFGSSTEQIEINMSGFEDGIYNLVLHNESDQMNFKVVKIK